MIDALLAIESVKDIRTLRPLLQRGRDGSAVRLEQCGDDRHELVGVEWLRAVAVIAGLDGAIAIFPARVCRDRDRRDGVARVVRLPHARDELVAIHVWHGDISDDQIEAG